MRFQTAVIRAVWIVAVTAGAFHLQADTIAPAAYSLGWLNQVSNGVVTAPGSYAGLGYTMDATTNPQITFTIDPVNETDVNAGLTYDFEFIGPVGATIPVDFNTYLTYFATTSSQGQGASQLAWFHVSSQWGDSIFDQNAGPDAPGGPGPNVDGIFSANILSNTVYHVYMGVSGNGQGTQLPGTGRSFGTASDYFRIDPNFANAGDYTLALSDGILNAPPSSPTPEPATFGLIGMALCGAVFFKRRTSSGRVRS
jgi:hypothetical protein